MVSPDKMNRLHDITVVIRSVGERTEQLCRQFVKQQGVPSENIHIIQEKPFSKAMRVGYQIGLDNDLTWTYCLDADVLLKEGALSELLKVAETQPDNVFGMSGKVLDKLFGTERSVGNHLYRTSSLSLMIQNIEDYENETIRPESHAKDQLKRNGLKWAKLNLYIGVHDFDQYYSDIARKAFVHAHKHVEELSEIVQFWRNKAKIDPDFEAALMGLANGLLHFDDVKINVEDFEMLSGQVEKQLGKKSDKIENFTCLSPGEVLNQMTNEDNYLSSISQIDLKHYRIFKKLFYDKSYLSLMYHLKEKIIKEFKGRPNN